MSTRFWKALRAEIDTMQGVHSNHAELIRLQSAYNRGDDSRAQAKCIADLLDDTATLLEAHHHRLARATTILPSADEYRAEAKRWRNGTQYVGP